MAPGVSNMDRQCDMIHFASTDVIHGVGLLKRQCYIMHVM